MQKTRNVRFGLFILSLSLVVSTFSATASETSIKPVSLFNGKDLSEWEGLRPQNKWLVVGKVEKSKTNPQLLETTPGTGIMVNGKEGRTTNIVSKYKHGDCQLHIEFMVPKGSNSGVYLQSLYEIQVLDSYGKKKEDLQFSDCGGIYARWDNAKKKPYEGHPPRVNASKAPGEWQSFDCLFRAPRFDSNGKKTENATFIWVKHNGVLVHENVEVTGGTRAHRANLPEAPMNALMLQGDHGPVAYRNIQLTPMHLD